jgi:tetraacyldisaccharide 4'-kinase
LKVQRGALAELKAIHHASAEGRAVSPAAWLLLRIVALLAACARGVKRALYRWRILRRVRVPALVVSVGNVTTGGSGKTPLTAWIANALGAEDASVVVLSRGYGRRGGGFAVWASREGRVRAGAREAGDEAYLLAKAIPHADVLVGKRRAATARLAWHARRPDAIVLDDGFQYWRLARDLDVLTLDLPLEEARLRPFPIGVLREPLSRLAAADLIVLTGAERADAQELARAHRLLAEHAPDVPWMTARFTPRALREVGRTTSHAVERLAGRRTLALAALGRPAGFFAAVTRLGAEAVLEAPYPDHHAFTKRELDHEVRRARAWGADLIVMTAKDEANVPPGYAFAIEALVLESELVLEEGSGPQLPDLLRGRLAARRPGI